MIKYIGDPLSLNRSGMTTRLILKELDRGFNYIRLDLDGRQLDSDVKDRLTEEEVRLLSKLTISKCRYRYIIHDLPVPMIRIDSSKINIAIVECKTDMIPDSWLGNIRRLDYIISLSNHTTNALRMIGIVDNVYTVGLDIDEEDGAQFLLPDNKKYLLIPELLSSSNWLDAIYKFNYEAIHNIEDATLVIPTISDRITSVIDGMKNVHAITTQLNDSDISSLIRSCDVYYNPAHSPGPDPYLNHAIDHGVDCMCTPYGYAADYISDGVEYNIIPATESLAEPWYDERYKWAAPHSLGINNILHYTPTSLLEAIHSIDSKESNSIRSVRVSVIILSYNNYEMLHKCIESLDNTSCKYPYEVIVLDNGSNLEDTTLHDYLKTIKHKVILSDINHGFSGGNNIAAEHSSSDILLFLNNDTEVRNGWLDPIVEDMDRDSRIGIVGTKLLYPNMTIQHAGVLFVTGSEQYAQHPYSEMKYNHPPSNIRKEMHTITGACLAIRKDIFNRIGGFDTSYVRGYYEDADMCCKVRDLGYKVIYEPDSIIVHKHGQSFKKLGDLSKQDFFIHNEAQFKMRHGHKVHTSPLIFNSKMEYRFNTYNIGILNSYMYTLGGGEKVTSLMANALEEVGNVDIISKNDVRCSIGSIEKRFNIKLDRSECITLHNTIDMKYYKNYDIFINGEWGSCDPGVANVNIYSVMFPHVVSDMSWLDTYDIIIANSEYTRSYIERYWKRDSIVLYPPVTMMTYDVNEIRKRNSIISVGRFFTGGHCKKHLVMIEAFKKLGRDDWELNLVGALSGDQNSLKYYRDCMEASMGHDNIHIHTNIDFNMIRKLYLESTIYWHAAGYGETIPMNMEHFGIAPVEGLSAGCYPILYNGGGLVEIVPNIPKWNSIDELIDMTNDAIEMNHDIESYIEMANEYSDDSYRMKLLNLIEKVYGDDASNI